MTGYSMMAIDNKTCFQYSESTDSYLSFDMKIVQIGPQTPKLQPFENHDILKH